MTLYARFDENGYTGIIQPRNSQSAISNHIIEFSDDYTVIYGYGGPGRIGFDVVTEREFGSHKLNFHPERGSSVVTAEAASVFIRSNSDPSFGAFSYATKQEAPD